MCKGHQGVTATWIQASLGFIVTVDAKLKKSPILADSYLFIFLQEQGLFGAIADTKQTNTRFDKAADKYQT